VNKQQIGFERATTLERFPDLRFIEADEFSPGSLEPANDSLGYSAGS
jgi:hypothetical protein